MAACQNGGTNDGRPSAVKPMNAKLARLVGTVLLSLLIPIHGSVRASGVEPGRSILIGTLDYSDTFTGTEDGGRPDRLYVPAVQAANAYQVENTYGKPQVSFDIGPGFSFAADKAGTPGLVNGNPPYPLGLGPNASGAGSATGFTQTGGDVDYALPYNGLRSHFIVQVDAVQTGDRVDISCGAGPGIFAPQSLSVFFRGDGSGNASLYNGMVDTVIRDFIPTFHTGITGSGQWNNYAVRYDRTAHQIELYVNQRSVGVIDLSTFAGGLYNNFSTAWVGTGAGLGAGENRVWTDNFQVGAPMISSAGDVTQPGDPIALVNGVNDGDADSGPPPMNEGVEHAIDNVGQKYLNFLDLGSGFAVQPQIGLSVVTGIRLYTADDAESGDPSHYLLEGSTAGMGGPWTTISSGPLALPGGRNPGGAAPLGQNFQTVTFANAAAYAAYRLTFPTLKDAAAANRMQIGEVEFLGTPLLNHPRISRCSSRGNCHAVYVQFNKPVLLDGVYSMICSNSTPAGNTRLFAEDFNAGDGGFTVNTPQRYDGPWIYDAGSGSWTEAGQGPESGHPNTSTLLSPPVSVSQPGAVTLTFAHRWSFEQDAVTWDGGQVRLSVNGGPFVAVPAAAFAQNGYNGVVAANSSSELHGQAAFVGNSPGFASGPITSVCALGSFAVGDSLRVAFMAASDGNTQGPFQPSWQIDSAQLTVVNPAVTPLVITSIGYGESSNVVCLSVTPDLPDSNVCCVTALGVHSVDGLMIDPEPSTACFVHGAEYPEFRILQRRFDGIGGVDLAALYADPRYPNSPSQTLRDPTGFFEAPSNAGDNYGAQVLGFAVAPVDGDYRVWVSADDHADVFLATDASPAHKVRVCVEPNWAGAREFADSSFDIGNGAPDDNGGRGVPPVNGSAAIHLLAGQVFYLEGNFKEGVGGDNFAVAFTINDPNPPANGSSPLSSQFFLPRRLGPNGEIFTRLCDVFCNPGPGDQTVSVGQSATFAATPDGTPPYHFQWEKDGVPIAGANAASCTTPPATAADDGAVYCVVVSNAFSTNRCCARLQVGPAESNCIDLRPAPQGSKPNPWIYGGVSFFGRDFNGVPLANLSVRTDGGFTGLDSGWETAISLANSPCDSIEITLVTFSNPARVTTYDAGGTALETKTMSVAPQVPETLRFHGQNVVRLVVAAPSDETLLLSLCCASCLEVTTTADSGPGSLRAAIECANNHPGLDTITFAIPGAGPHAIRPLSPLPIITDAVVVDGWTQPGAAPNSLSVGNNAQLQVEIDGSLTSTSSHGLVVNAGNSTLRGLVVNRNDGAGILLNSSSNVVEGCFIGTDASGSMARPNDHGVRARAAAFNRIGGASPGSRNVISGNRYAGIYVDGQASIANRIQGNYVGADATGLNPLGNGTSLGNGAGVAISGANFNLVGGPNPGEGNVISANRQSNLIIFGDTNTVQGNYVGPDGTGTSSLGSGGGYYGLIILNGTGNVIGGSSADAGNVISGNTRGIDVLGPATVIAGNRIGTDVSGTRPLGNAVHGIMCYPPFSAGAGSFSSVIGGTNAGSRNIIAFNGADGIKVEGAISPPDGIRILGNSIHDNLGLGIDLSTAPLSDGARGDGPSPNDPLDPDGGPNRLQNHPILDSARLAGGNVVIEGRLNSKANEAYRLEFFANTAPDPSGYGEGDLFLGFVNVTTDAAGNAAFTTSFPAVATKLHYTATATDLNGNTSEFSPAAGLTSGAAIPCLWNTGVDSSGNPRPDDASELHYRLVQGSPVAGLPFVARAAGGFPVPPWLDDNASSAWIAPTTNTQAAGATDGSALYRYETVFELTGFDPSSAVISGRWSTDNGGRDILINGISTGQANAAQFGAWTAFHIRSGFIAGLNRLTFLVSNGEGEPNPFGPTGLRVEMSGAGTLNQRLFIERRGSQVAVRWQGAGFMLQAADAFAGPWTDFSAGTSVDGVTFEVTTSPGGQMRFFRLRLAGSCATLEDWFDPQRRREDYLPTGWKGPPGARARAVKGHEYGGPVFPLALCHHLSVRSGPSPEKSRSCVILWCSPGGLRAIG